jgi:hypothetical protein
MIGEFIHVTKWDNKHQEFVDVGLLCESDSLEKAFPTVSFNYAQGYLDKYAPLYPSVMLRADSSTLINDADFNVTIPLAFTSYLPSHTMKNALSAMIDDFDDMTPFQQLKSVTGIKGDFGAVQLNYNNEIQNNSLPSDIEQAARLLDIMKTKNYGLLSASDVNSVYDYDTHNPAVRMVHWNIDNTYNIATVTAVEDLLAAKQSLIMQGVMEASGINVLALEITEHNSKHYIVQYDPKEKISSQGALTLIEDSVHINPLLRNTKYISDETNLCAADVSNFCKSIGGMSSAKEVYARSIVAQMMNQRGFNVNQIKFEEKGDSWKLSPQVINPLSEDDSFPFQLPLVSGQSNHVKYIFKETVSPMLARAFGISSSVQDKILENINDAFSSVVEIAELKGVEIEFAHSIKKIHEKSGLFKIVPSSNVQRTDNPPEMEH